MINDALSDMITRIRNGYLAGKAEVVMPHTNLLERIAKVLVEEKYLTKAEAVTDDKGHKNLKLNLAYAGHSPAISTIKRISKPGVRIYTTRKAIRPVLSGLGCAIISTSKGILTDRTARKERIGGEVLFELW